MAACAPTIKGARPPQAVMALGCKKRTLERHTEMKLCDGAQDSFALESLVYRCSFTSLACTSSKDSTTCTFYWVDASRGLLGKGTIYPPDPHEMVTPPVQEKKMKGAPSHNNLSKVATLSLSKLNITKSQHPKAERRRVGSHCDMSVLLSGLNHPTRVAVSPSKDWQHLVFFLEDRVARAPAAHFSVYDAITQQHHSLIKDLDCPQGLQVTDKLDVIFMRRCCTKETPGGALEVCCIPGESVQAFIEHHHHQQQQPASDPIILTPLVLMRMDDSEQTGNRTRFQDVVLLSNGQLALGGRQGTSTWSDADIEGVIMAYEPASGTLPDPVFPPAHPLTPVGNDGPRRGRLEKLRVKTPPPESPPPRRRSSIAGSVVDHPPQLMQSDSGKRRFSAGALPPGAKKPQPLPQSAQASPSPSLGKIGKKGSSGGLAPTALDPPVPVARPQDQASASVQAPTPTPAQAMSSTDKAGKRRSSVSLPPKGGKKAPASKVAETPAPPPEPVVVPAPRPPPIIPPLRMEVVFDRLFGAHTTQPVDTPGAIHLHQRHQWPKLSPSSYEGSRGVWYHQCLPIIRQMAISPTSSRLLLTCCGATAQDDPVSLGFLDRPTPQSHEPVFQPVLGGFCTCAAMDDYGNVLLRSARGEGELLVLWARGSHGWARLMTERAARVAIPLTPKLSPKEPTHFVPEAPIIDGKVAAWSQALISGAGWQKKSHEQSKENIFTASGRVNTIVVLRCRPMLDLEKDAGAKSSLSCTMNEVSVEGITAIKQSRTYHFDRVFNTDATQADLYNSVIAPVVQRVLEGYNCTVWAYGQTGSGKTFTMEGSMDDGDRAGVIPRSVYNIFNQLNKLPKATYRVYVSHVELYNEQPFDLLKSHREVEDKLRIEEGKDRRPRVRGARQVVVRSPHDIFRILQKSIKNRHTAETLCNRSSSRSHAIFSINVRCEYHHPLDGEVIFEGRLNLVDLSGSENIKRSGAEGVRAKEAGNIGQSLLAFSRVITALVQGNPHVPYRDSNLTYLLSDSLGGKSYSTIILNVTPSNLVLDETLNTLKYASLARGIISTPEQMLRKQNDGEDGGLGYDASSGMSLGKLHEPINPFQGSVPMRPRSAAATIRSPPRTRTRLMSTRMMPSSAAAAAAETTKKLTKTYHCPAQEWVRDVILDPSGDLQPRAVESLQAIFDSLDRNKDGLLTWAEVNNMETLWASKSPRPGSKAMAAAKAKRIKRHAVGHGVLTQKAFLDFTTFVAKRDPLLLHTIFTKHGYDFSLARAADDARQTMLQELHITDGPKARKEEEKEDEEACPSSSGFISPKEIYKYMVSRESIRKPRTTPNPTARPKSAGLMPSQPHLPERVIVRIPPSTETQPKKSPRGFRPSSSSQDLLDDDLTLSDSFLLERVESSGGLYTLADFETTLSPTIRTPLSSSTPKRPRSAPSFRTSQQTWSPKVTGGSVTKTLSGNLFLEDKTRYLPPMCEWCHRDKTVGSVHSIAFCGRKDP